MGDIKAWLESIGPSPDWLDARDPTKAGESETPSDTPVTITIPGWIVAKAKSCISAVLTRLGCLRSKN
jgi:hypothetical protein